MFVKNTLIIYIKNVWRKNAYINKGGFNEEVWIINYFGLKTRTGVENSREQCSSGLNEIIGLKVLN